MFHVRCVVTRAQVNGHNYSLTKSCIRSCRNSSINSGHRIFLVFCEDSDFSPGLIIIFNAYATKNLNIHLGQVVS